MHIKGTGIKLLDDVNTDLIIAGKYTKTLDMNELAEHVFEDLDSSLKLHIKGKVLVAGSNFGCGSSREQAPLALKYAGVTAIVAKSFARIFFRNAINIGLPVLIADTDYIANGDVLKINLHQGLLSNLTKNKTIKCSQLTPVMLKILEKGGLVNFLKETGSFSDSFLQI